MSNVVMFDMLYLKYPKVCQYDKALCSPHSRSEAPSEIERQIATPLETDPPLELLGADVRFISITIHVKLALRLAVPVYQPQGGSQTGARKERKTFRYI